MDAANLLSGLLGAMIGIVASLVIYLADRNRSERGAVRAVLAEARANIVQLQMLVEEDAGFVPISGELYRAHLPAIAARLSPDDLTDVGGAFLFASYGERLRLDMLAGRRLTPEGRRVLAGMHDAFVLAGAALERRG